MVSPLPSEANGLTLANRGDRAMLEIVVGVATLLGLAIVVALLLFTGQGRELAEGTRYWLGRVVRKMRSGRGPNRTIGRRDADAESPQPHVGQDASRFVRDVTIPDGTRVLVGTRFKKTWEIQNVGDVAWEGRRLVREGPLEGHYRLSTLR